MIEVTFHYHTPDAEGDAGCHFEFVSVQDFVEQMEEHDRPIKTFRYYEDGDIADAMTVNMSFVSCTTWEWVDA